MALKEGLGAGRFASLAFFALTCKTSTANYAFIAGADKPLSEWRVIRASVAGLVAAAVGRKLVAMGREP